LLNIFNIANYLLGGFRFLFYLCVELGQKAHFKVQSIKNYKTMSDEN
jgi:hypothetical protein